jgi:hypothetical protein
MEKSRRGDREKLKSQNLSIRLLTEELKNAEHLLSQESIERHKYGEGVIQLCVSPACGCGTGLRSAIKAVGLLNDQLHPGMEEMPCHNSIKNWIEKSGYFTYSHSWYWSNQYLLL